MNNKYVYDINNTDNTGNYYIISNSIDTVSAINNPFFIGDVIKCGSVIRIIIDKYDEMVKLNKQLNNKAGIHFVNQESTSLFYHISKLKNWDIIGKLESTDGYEHMSDEDILKTINTKSINKQDKINDISKFGIVTRKLDD